MAIPTSMETLLAGDIIEKERIEFKAAWDPKASLKTICAFANDLDNLGGGYLVIGVRDKEGKPKELVGIPPEQAGAWLKDIFNKCKLIQPAYMPIAEVVDYRGKAFIVLWCPGGSTRPYSAPKGSKGQSGRVCWVRKDSSTAKPTPEEESDLYALANNVPFDDRPNHSAALDDLSIMLVKSYLKEVGSTLYDRADKMGFADLCLNMHIADATSECVKPLNAGLLFFCADPQTFFPDAYIEVVELPDGERGDRIVEHLFKGPLHVQLQDALRYLENNLVEEHVLKGRDGEPGSRHFNYPPTTLREVLANAVCHKGYDEREPIQVRVLPDRIEVLSHPGDVCPIGIEDLKTYRMTCGRSRNRRIGEYLKELGFTAGRNVGIHQMLKALRDNGSPDPLIETDEQRMSFMATIYAHHGDGGKSAVPRGKAGRREAVLAYFADNPESSLAAARDVLGIPIATLNRDVSALKAEGRLERMGSRGRWSVIR